MKGYFEKWKLREVKEKQKKRDEEKNNHKKGNKIQQTSDIRSSQLTSSYIYRTSDQNNNNNSSAEARKIQQFKRKLRRHPLLWLGIKGLNNNKMNALIDTGSTVNIISSIVVECFNHKQIDEEVMQMHGINGVKVVKTIWYEIVLNINKEDINVIVMSMEIKDINILLGMPFIKQVGGIIDIPMMIIWTKKGPWRITNEKSVVNIMKVEDEEKIKKVNKEIMKTTIISEEQLSILKAKVNTEMFTKEAEKIIENTLLMYSHIWTRTGVGQAKGIEFKIETKNDYPIVVPSRQIPLKYQKPLEEYINKMLKDGVIIPSNSPYRTWPVIVPKKTGDLRICADYRALNEHTIKDKGPIPRINDLLQATEGSKYYCLIDLRAGFWQIPIELWSRKKTAFATHRGLYEYIVMPFGLVNAPSFFQRWVEGILGHLRYKGVIIYIDDILIHTATENEFIELFQNVLFCLSEANAQINLDKTNIGMKSMKFLGHVLEDGKRSPDKERINVLRGLRNPTSIRDIRAMIGVINYYQKYIKNFSVKIKPISDLLIGHGKVTRNQSKNIKIHWDDELTQIWHNVLNELCEAILRNSNWEDSFVLETDASKYGVGAVLYCQKEYYKILKETNGQQRALPVCYLSKKFNKTESNWSTPEQEAFAMLWALEKCDAWVRGREVIIRTDHKNLRSLKMLTHARNGKLMRWAGRLTEYNVQIEYIKGKDNEIADFLSRYYEEDPLWKRSMDCYESKEKKYLNDINSVRYANSIKTYKVLNEGINNQVEEMEYTAIMDEILNNKEFVCEMSQQIQRILTKTEFLDMAEYLYKQSGIEFVREKWSKEIKYDNLKECESWIGQSFMVDIEEKQKEIENEKELISESIINIKGQKENQTQQLVNDDSSDDLIVIIDDDEESGNDYINIGFKSYLPFSNVLKYQFPTLEEIQKRQKIERTLSDYGAAWSLKNGYIYYNQKIWIPPSMRHQVLDATHVNPTYYHSSTKQMRTIIQRYYNWKGLAADIQQYLKACVPCQRAKPYINLNKLGMRKHPVRGVNEVIYIDFWGPIIWDKQQYLFLTIIDYNTKWAEAVIIPNMKIKCVMDALFQTWFINRGIPKTIISDNGKPFISKEYEQFCKTFGIKKVHTTVYHPEGNAPVEQFHRTLKNRLNRIRSTYQNSIDIKTAITWALMSYRSMPLGPDLRSPFFMSYGYEFNINGGMYSISNQEEIDKRRQLLLQIRQDIMEKSQWVQEKVLQQNLEIEDDKKFELGEMVIATLTKYQLRRLSKVLGGKKLCPKWTLPMKVEHVGSSGYAANIRCPVTGLLLRVYINRCRKITKPITDGLKEAWKQSEQTDKIFMESLIPIQRHKRKLVRDKLTKCKVKMKLSKQVKKRKLTTNSDNIMEELRYKKRVKVSN